MITPLQLVVLAILDNASSIPGWSMHGFGLLRLYIRSIGRLHIWDSTYRYPGVSMIHNHSWDLKSTVVVGSLINRRYAVLKAPLDVGAGESRAYHTKRFITGMSGRPISDEAIVGLYPIMPDGYLPGSIYSQLANEIHQTDAQDGTVTLMERQDDAEGKADIFWPVGTTWGTAIPRPALPGEIVAITSKAIKLFPGVA